MWAGKGASAGAKTRVGSSARPKFRLVPLVMMIQGLDTEVEGSIVSGQRKKSILCCMLLPLLK